MEILLQLGANSTAFVQFGLFVIAITFLTVVVFNPYFKAYDERMKKTKGADAVAKEAGEEAKNLSLIYQTKAREINNTIKTIFDNKRSDAGKVSNDLLAQAKIEAEKSIVEARAQIEKQKATAQTQIKQISQEISEQLKQKFEGGL